MRPWEARTGPAGGAFLHYTTSAAEDRHLAPYDMAATIAHVLGLHGSGLLTREEAEALVQGVQDLHKRLVAGTWAPAPEDEDVHMAMERALAALPGGAKLHTARSRNDEVATALLLWARAQSHELAAGTMSLVQALTKLAEATKAVTVQGETHHRPAAPVTVGHTLLGHAVTLQSHAEALLHLVRATPPCPLGSGALAGSGLPIRPEIPARLLGLAPVLNTAQGVGDRTYVHRVLGEAALLATTLGRLSSDLIRLSDPRTDGVRLPAAWCSGSSLMPHKLNPDALELTRARAHTVLHHHQAAVAITAGAPLTYVRDLQEAKAHALEGTLLAHSMVRAVTAIVEGSQPGQGSAVDPTCAALDLVEDRIGQGEAFRDAYTDVARAVGTRTEWPAPRLRASAGGPAPETVSESAAVVAATTARLGAALAKASAETPLALLQQPATTLIENTVEVEP